ncbi:Homocysteine S-methyltransferase [Cantharellus anzutake]|uniref:Homocysteine S-methyltransferase n=1 Tax=Cantharellus anzutake TaxID=1750568 RepID=UPI001906D19C|nr:Homocysteine S-methyltransferase [Cantharellus anzutake]KAF8326643.1 Homocysteine S-methyltransferase [Cantharellus anzutake]
MIMPIRRSAFDLEGVVKGRVPIRILDGGMGTVLRSSGVAFKGSLWASSANLTSPQAIVDSHLAFLNAGADILLSNTYQATPQFEIPQFLRTGVQLAASARNTYVQGQSGFRNRQRPHIALSLGPYGATLPLAAEYTGLYPPPVFGPAPIGSHEESASKRVSGSQQLDSSNDDIDSYLSTNAFFTTPVSREGSSNASHSSEHHANEASVEALAEWHYKRCSVYALHAHIWNEIDYLAFETVPLVREAVAIRRALHKLYASPTSADDSTKIELKPWWISFTFPNGELPEESYVGGPKLGVEEIVHALFTDDNASASAETKPEVSSTPLPIPFAIGINCTAPCYIPSILAQLSSALSKLHEKLAHQTRPSNSRPWLVLYPNSGCWYNAENKTWHKVETGPSTVVPIGEIHQLRLSWAEEVVRIIEPYVSLPNSESPFGGFIIGGCCQTKPDDIEKLRNLLLPPS